jgi:mannosylglycerate hydrolase
MRIVHVVSHTHWDREWYHPAERFRQGLVALVDELLDDPPPAGRSFLLDGQAVILEDYLEVRPERASELATLLREGRIEAGPWYVLADELIPGGEALVRNLLSGRRILRALRAESPPVLYCPDSFGHPASLPEIARGFQKAVVVLWRGFGGARWPRVNLVRWQGPSGADVLLHHLTRSGYELGSSLPTDANAAVERWERIRAEFEERKPVGPELLLNGADHHARQRNLDEALAALAGASAPDAMHAGALTDFAADVQERADARIPEVRGELRDSYGYTWTLQGTLGSRAPQKRRYIASERDLVRDVEPWAALAAFHGGTSRRPLVRAAWKPLLLCQPHDTLCGCSIDQVARAMDARLESVATQAEGLRDDAIFELVGHDREAARVRSDSWQPLVLIRNCAARSRSGVAVAAVTIKLRDVPVGPGSAPRVNEADAPALPFADAIVTHERTEAPRAYPDNDAVIRFPVAFWVENVPGYGITSIPLADAEPTLLPPDGDRVRVERRRMSNGRLTLRWDRRGRVALEDAVTKRAIADLVRWDSGRDTGDLYTPSIGKPKLRPHLVDTQLLHEGPIIGAVEQRWRLSARDEHIDVRLRFVLEAGAGFLRFGILGDNAARDHRLRLAVNTDVARGRTFADAAFMNVERLPIKVSAREAKMERPLPTAPLHRYVSLFNGNRGATLYSDGCTEYETRDAAILVTLLRSVGELSRNDLPERPGHAGWPSPTPEAQCIGLFQAEFGLLLHGPRSSTVTDHIERVADDVLFPLTGETLRSALRVPEPCEGVELRGAGLGFSALKESEEGDGLVLRCVNYLDEAVEGEWRLNARKGPSEAHRARLDETTLERLELSGTSVRFVAEPHEVVTILVR